MRLVVKFSIFLLIIFCSLYGIYRIYKNQIFKVSNIDYIYTEKNPYLNFQHEKIEDQLSDISGSLIWNVDIFEVEKKIEALSWIEDARVSKRYPNQIQIELFPRKILATLLRTSNKIQPISTESKILEIADISKAPDAPILASKKFLRDDSLRAKALNLLKELPQEGSFSLKNVSEISPYEINNSNNNFQIFLKNSHALIIIDTENVALKAARVSRVIDYMEPEELKSRIIDANFSKKVLVKPRNHR